MVCASDRCLWIRKATFDDGALAAPAIARYERLATLCGLSLSGSHA